MLQQLIEGFKLLEQFPRFRLLRRFAFGRRLHVAELPLIQRMLLAQGEAGLLKRLGRLPQVIRANRQRVERCAEAGLNFLQVFDGNGCHQQQVGIG